MLPVSAVLDCCCNDLNVHHFSFWNKLRLNDCAEITAAEVVESHCFSGSVAPRLLCRRGLNSPEGYVAASNPSRSSFLMESNRTDVMVIELLWISFLGASQSPHSICDLTSWAISSGVYRNLSGDGSRSSLIHLWIYRPVVNAKRWSVWSTSSPLQGWNHCLKQSDCRYSTTNSFTCCIWPKPEIKITLKHLV